MNKRCDGGLQVVDHLHPALSGVDLCLLLDQTGVIYLEEDVSDKNIRVKTYNLTARPLRRFMRTTTIRKTKMRKKM